MVLLHSHGFRQTDNTFWTAREMAGRQNKTLVTTCCYCDGYQMEVNIWNIYFVSILVKCVSVNH